MSETKDPKGQAPQGDQAKLDPKTAEADTSAKASAPLGVGDPLQVLVMVGGPAIERLPGVITRVHKAKDGPPLLDILTTNRNGVRVQHDRLPQEPAEGAHLNGGVPFPCYSRRG